MCFLYNITIIVLFWVRHFDEPRNKEKGTLMISTATRDDADFRQMFFKLALDTFDIDFEPWYNSGYWSDSYVCHSHFEQRQMVANVSVHRLDLILGGKRLAALQIGTVMTHPAWRNRGLAKQLMEHALGSYKYDVVYLFAHAGVVSFYEKLGFSSVRQSQFEAIVQLPDVPVKPMRKLDINSSQDRALIYRLVQNRVPISRRCGLERDAHLFMFYVLNVLGKCISYVEDLDTLLVYRENKERMDVFDVVSSCSVDFLPLARCIVSSLGNFGLSQQRFRFYFTPDFPDITPEAVSYDDTDDRLMVRSSPELSLEGICFPYMAHG